MDAQYGVGHVRHFNDWLCHPLFVAAYLHILVTGREALRAEGEQVHHLNIESRCWEATTTQMRSRVATDSDRSRASSNSDGPPRKEQNCFGTTSPIPFVVTLRKRLPSPAASTTTQLLVDSFIDTALLKRKSYVAVGV